MCRQWPDTNRGVIMGENIPQILSDEWYNFVENGLTKTTTYLEMNVATYTASSGVHVRPVISTNIVEMIWGKFSFTRTNSPATEKDGQAFYTIDRKLLFPVDLLPVVPKVGDHVIESGMKWLVKGIDEDAADAHYGLHVRPLDATP